MQLKFSLTDEIKDIIIADVILTVAFAFAFSGGLFGKNLAQSILYFIPIAAIAVPLNFVLHELMHKFTAQHYGAQARFRSSNNGLIITLFSGMFGFLLGMPGATYIYANSFTVKENGIVSLAGPAINMLIFLVFLGAGSVLSLGSYASHAISYVIFISLFLAFFNMLPIFPLDGSKVLKWNPPIYLTFMAILLVLLEYFTGVGIVYLGFIVLIALFMSTMSRMVLL